MLLVSPYTKHIMFVKRASTDDVVVRDYSREAKLCQIPRSRFWTPW
jgi:hypothetical protein